MDHLRGLLDEFLGKDRNLLPKDRVKIESHFTDPDICKFYLCGLCPNELFTNANVHDLGPCPKLHIENCVKQYQVSKDKEVYDYEREWVRLLESLIAENDKKIKKNKERLAANPNENIQDEDLELDRELNQRIEEMDKKIQSLLKQAEDLGEEGKISEAQNTMNLVEEFKSKKIELQKEELIAHEKNENKKMSVCEICGALLFVGDKEKRSISHLEGKKHMGFARIRAAMEEYYKNKSKSGYNRGGDHHYRHHDGYHRGGHDRNGGYNRDNNNRYEPYGGRGNSHHNNSNNNGNNNHNHHNNNNNNNNNGNNVVGGNNGNVGGGDRERRFYNFDYREEPRGNYNGFREDHHGGNSSRGGRNDDRGYNNDNYRDRDDDRRKR